MPRLRKQTTVSAMMAAEDAKENDFSVQHGFRIVISYPAGSDGAKVWIITEVDRSSTCVLLPEEY